MIMDKLFMQGDRRYLDRFHGIHHDITDRRVLVSAPPFEFDRISACRNTPEEIFSVPIGNSIKGIRCIKGRYQGRRQSGQYLAFQFSRHYVVKHGDIRLEQELTTPEENGP